jgi:hypothetical protein
VCTGANSGGAYPSKAPTAPTAAPTAAPTYLLQEHVQLPVDATVAEDGTDTATLLTVRADVPATGDERVTVACAVAGPSAASLALVDAAPIEVTSAGVSGARFTFAVRGVWDVVQLRTRDAVATCTVTSTLPGKSKVTLAIPIAVRGVAQPSLRLFCVNTTLTGTLSNEALAASCSTALTTNGGDRILALGGDCATCPQPPFDAHTSVTLGGLNLFVYVAPDGKSIEFVTPTVADLKSRSDPDAPAFEYDEYVPLVIATPAGAQGEIEGVAALGPGAATAEGSVDLACAARGLCPPGRPGSSGAFYLVRCLDWLDPIADQRSLTTDDAAVAALFAYGTPESGCRACPLGCRCPGGERCRSVDGYFTEEEDLGTRAGPTRCDAPALLRCPAVKGPGGTQCSEGYSGFACGVCDKGWYRDRATCQKCEARGVFDAVIVPLASTTAVALFVYPLLVGLKFGAFFISDRVEKHGGGDDAPPQKPNNELFKIAALQTAKFVVHIATAVHSIAVVNTAAATAVDSEVLRSTNALLGIFLVNPPLVHPDCAEETIGIAAGFVVESSVLLGALACFAAFVALMVRRLRPEQLCCGWRCCGDRINVVRIVVHTHITPFLRYTIACVLSISYARYTKTALDVINCRASAALDGALALATDPTIACFTGAHSAAFVAALLTLAVVGFAWPIVFIVSLVFKFAHRREITDAAPSRWDLLCEPVADVAARRQQEQAALHELFDWEREEAEEDGVIVGARPDGSVEPEAGDDDEQETGDVEQEIDGSPCVDLLVELGCRCSRSRSATLVRVLILAEGPRARAHAAFLDTPFEPQYFWLIALRMCTTLLLNVANALLVSTTPMIASALALFIITMCLMAAFTVSTTAACPYHRSDRWNVALNIGVFFLTSLSAAVNFVIALQELGYTGAYGAVIALANVNAVALVLMFCGVFVAFMLSESLGLCHRCGCACHYCDSTSPTQDVLIAGDRHAVDGRTRGRTRQTPGVGETRAIEMHPLRIDDMVCDSTVEQANPLVERNHDRAGQQTAEVVVVPGERSWTFPHVVAPLSTGATLPAGWIVVRDEASNTHYYYDAETGEKSSTCPHVVAPSPQGAALPAGWSVFRDAKRNVDYYYNSETDEKSWSVPLHAGWCAQTGEDGSTRYIHTPSCAWQSTVPTEADTIAAVKVALNVALPPGWVAISNSVVGVYYANPVSVSPGKCACSTVQRSQLPLPLPHPPPPNEGDWLVDARGPTRAPNRLGAAARGGHRAHCDEW